MSTELPLPIWAELDDQELDQMREASESAARCVDHLAAMGVRISSVHSAATNRLQIQVLTQSGRLLGHLSPVDLIDLTGREPDELEAWAAALLSGDLMGSL